ncbi:DUF262 domain-containing protein [Savagea sp. SN6]|uniref:DUF262 domain-containing protein n=1 Tax=Savagea serpentis TaxID=2785297 RepID=A0A8J7GBG0_9BACL|nr:DUF262 domain-containing protein [Savagea serpentis]MBF4500466.1 DUF262 domain-containing protein [Savagea serpentis]
MENLLKADSITVQKYLNVVDGRFRIPFTQRPYEWTKKQVSRLFYDAMGVAERKNHQHILNFVTIYKEEIDGQSYRNIYDGQQRTVTLFLIVAAFVELIDEMEGSDNSASKIRSEFLRKEGWEIDKKEEPNLVFDNEDTTIFFEQYVIDREQLAEFQMTDHEKHIKQNYDWIAKELRRYIVEQNLDVKEIRRYLSQILNNMHIIVLQTINEEVANQMFETLNNTGKKLANFYVLKNNCVKMIGEEKTSKYWEEIEQNTDGLNKNQFFTQFVSLYNGKTSDAKTIDALELHGHFKTPEAVEKMLKHMVEASFTFLTLHQPAQRRNQGKEESVKEQKRFGDLIEAVQLFKATQYRPVIMAMEVTNAYTLEEVNNVLESILHLQVRNFFIGERKNNTVEAFFPRIAQEIMAKAYESQNIIHKIQEMTLSDQSVKAALQERIFKKTEVKRVRYLLQQIYTYENSEEILINDNSMHVNLEHILPQNPREDSLWKDLFLQETIENYVGSLGNMTLVLSKANSSIGNKEFDEKRVILAKSQIPQNQEIAQNEQWTPYVIDQRVESLADSLVKVF